MNRGGSQPTLESLTGPVNYIHCDRKGEQHVAQPKLVPCILGACNPDRVILFPVSTKRLSDPRFDSGSPTLPPSFSAPAPHPRTNPRARAGRRRPPPSRIPGTSVPQQFYCTPVISGPISYPAILGVKVGTSPGERLLRQNQLDASGAIPPFVLADHWSRLDRNRDVTR